ncbi:MAG: 8-oxoguanine glycosylase ogg1 [Cirrosporium novae-zelandiae]|nr:MAG: 8-oxoguanine glycosylase ogg1 [Cirrosporium novae-zelandiae]
MTTGLRVTEWRKLPVSLTELCLNTTLRCGQSFRWRQSDENEWSCSLHGRILSLRQDPKFLHYRAIFPSSSSSQCEAAPPTPPPSVPVSSNGLGTPTTTTKEEEGDDTPSLIHHYLNLTPNLTNLYKQWSSADLNFKKKAPQFTGIRILQQDAWEALICFICSSNNNISRICQMVDKLCKHYGPLIGTLDGHAYHDFPTPAALTGLKVESHLRELGFGYRAKYIYRTAVMVANERPEGWLESLRNPDTLAFNQPKAAPITTTSTNSPTTTTPPSSSSRPSYHTAQESLLQLQGVGPKVADCICLMGLGWGEAVPVDTHVWQIAQRDYKFGRGKHKSLTKATYDAVGDHFRRLWGMEAGWAHSVLFTADLKTFRGGKSGMGEKEEVEVEVKKEKGKRKLDMVDDEEEDGVKVENDSGTDNKEVPITTKGTKKKTKTKTLLHTKTKTTLKTETETKIKNEDEDEDESTTFATSTTKIEETEEEEKEIVGVEAQPTNMGGRRTSKRRKRV